MKYIAQIVQQARKSTVTEIANRVALFSVCTAVFVVLPVLEDARRTRMILRDLKEANITTEKQEEKYSMLARANISCLSTPSPPVAKHKPLLDFGA